MSAAPGPAAGIRRLATGEAGFEARLRAALRRGRLSDDGLVRQVAGILEAVRRDGDRAVLEHARRFDGAAAGPPAVREVTPERMAAALEGLPGGRREALDRAAGRIRRYHERQKASSWRYEEADGSTYGQVITPLDRAGLYVPGGKASYPSSMLMLAIPARVAGVREIIAAAPPSGGEGDELVYAAAALAGVDRIFAIGGAQAIAAMAFGTETVPKVDKIAGPGNRYVSMAKKLVFGEVGIDMIAGPSELTVICDGGADPDWTAMDLFAQAEHDEQAQSILIATDADLLERVGDSIDRLLPGMARRAIIETSLRERGLFILAEDLAAAAAASNLIAPEHLQISAADPDAVLDRIRHAGAIFLGRHSAEALGDYCAGPSHVLPTGGSARFFSALGVYDFQKRASVIQCSPDGARRLAVTAAELARGEGLPAHALSAECRLRSGGGPPDRD